MDLLITKTNGKNCKFENVNKITLTEIEDTKLFIIKSGTNINDLDSDFLAISTIKNLQMVLKYVDDNINNCISELLKIFGGIKILSECPQEFE